MTVISEASLRVARRSLGVMTDGSGRDCIVASWRCTYRRASAPGPCPPSCGAGIMTAPKPVGATPPA